jgi:hypothetical protein
MNTRCALLAARRRSGTPRSARETEQPGRGGRDPDPDPTRTAAR